MTPPSAFRQAVTAEQALGADQGGDAFAAERVGSDAWFDPIQWNAHKLPFSQRLVPDAEGHYLASILVHGPKGLTISSDQSIFVGIADHNLVLKLGRLDDLLKSEN